MDKDTNNYSKIIIWDLEELPKKNKDITLLWNSYEQPDDKNIISIPKVVEENSDYYRSKYLAWIYDISEKKIKDKKIVEYLQLYPGFSYWWMTSIAQRYNISDNSQISNTIKCFLLEEIIKKYKSSHIIYKGNNKFLIRTIQYYCKINGIKFYTNYKSKPSHFKFDLKKLYHFLPYTVKAHIFYMVYFFKNIPLIFGKRKDFISSDIVIVDVLIHLDKDSYVNKKFKSNYWHELVDKLNESKKNVVWLHNYYPHKPLLKSSSAKKFLEEINKTSNDNQQHVLIESNLNLIVYIKALKLYYQLWFLSVFLINNRGFFLVSGGTFDYKSFFQKDFINSLRGQDAMMNCIRIALYNKTFSNLSSQNVGVYIQENQPWEMALIQIWNRYKQSELIGVPHSTVRYWDLRYFYDNRNFSNIEKLSLPRPSKIAVNGQVAKKNYIEAGYPKNEIIEVEALRYLHLAQPINRENNHEYLTVLICGDFLSSTNLKLLSWVAIAAKSLPKNTRYILKPHPAQPISHKIISDLNIILTDDTLASIGKKCDVAFTSNITSSAVDLYSMGVPVLQILDGNSFNVSPLRDIESNTYITNSYKLAETIINVTSKKNNNSHQDYFYLDRKLPRWRALLDLNGY